jgi:SapC
MTENGIPEAAAAAPAPALPLFYRRPAPLSSLLHFGLSLEAPGNYLFARNTNAIPLNVSEFSLAARHYPIVFTATDPITPVAVVGTSDHRNLFVDAAGNWQAGAYVPAYVRRYPFLFIEDPAKDEFLLGIDEAAEAMREHPGPENKLFWNGQPTTLVERAMKFCAEYQVDIAFTRKFCAAMTEERLLSEKEAGFTLNSGQRSRLTGFRLIEEARFDKVPGKILLRLRRRQFLHPIYLHLISTANWAALLDLAATQAA